MCPDAKEKGCGKKRTAISWPTMPSGRFCTTRRGRRDGPGPPVVHARGACGASGPHPPPHPGAVPDRHAVKRRMSNGRRKRGHPPLRASNDPVTVFK